MQLSEKCLGIAPSLTLEIDAKAKAMKAAGEDIIGFGAGEPDFDTPEFIKAAAVEALKEGKTKYTPASGTVALKKAVAEKLLKDNGLSYEPSQIVITNGAKHALFNALAAILNPGDEVIIPSPCWVSYPELVRINSGVPVFVHASAEDSFIPKVEDLAKAVTPRTKAIILNSPNNPCGYVLPEAVLRQIADLAVEKDLFVISDEIYEMMVYEGEKHVSIASFGPEIKERTILVNGLSKAFSMTGWRIGYTASAPVIAKAMGNLQSHVTSNPNSIAQHASVAALNGPKDELEAMVKEFDARRQLMVERINAIPGLSCIAPRGAFYVMVNISSAFGKSYEGRVINGSLDFCAALLEGEKVAMVPGIAFEADGYCRMSYATSRSNIEKGIDRLASFMAKLK
ncbi:MAG: pyridoxal phosphate-dependent aminotransferase [Christensenellales bacterium]|jgi:aspartate aminotransferase